MEQEEVASSIDQVSVAVVGFASSALPRRRVYTVKKLGANPYLLFVSLPQIKFQILDP